MIRYRESDWWWNYGRDIQDRQCWLDIGQAWHTFCPLYCRKPFRIADDEKEQILQVQKPNDIDDWSKKRVKVTYKWLEELRATAGHVERTKILSKIVFEEENSCICWHELKSNVLSSFAIFKSLNCTFSSTFAPYVVHQMSVSTKMQVRLFPLSERCLRLASLKSDVHTSS